MIKEANSKQDDPELPQNDFPSRRLTLSHSNSHYPRSWVYSLLCVFCYLLGVLFILYIHYPFVIPLNEGPWDILLMYQCNPQNVHLCLHSGHHSFLPSLPHVTCNMYLILSLEVLQHSLHRCSIIHLV